MKSARWRRLIPLLLLPALASCAATVAPFRDEATPTAAPGAPGSWQSLPPAKTPDGGPLSFASIAGRYYWGDGMGLNQSLEIEDDGDWEFTWRGCLGLYGESSGRGRIVEGRFVLEMTGCLGFSKGRECACIPIWWGDRVYLLGTQELAEFCNEINWGREPREDVHGWTWLRVRPRLDSWNLPPAAGLPDLPAEIRSRVRASPLTSTVVSVEGEDAARLDVGSRDGVFRGMEFHVDLDENEYLEAEVIELSEESCVVRQLYALPGDPPLAVGMQAYCEAKGAGRAK